MNSPVLVAIPSYGHNDMTRQAVTDCLREQVDVLVIDNEGGYVRVANEKLRTMDRNVGWGEACERAMRHFLLCKQYHSIILLNNDVRLSKNFCGGLLATALQQPKAGIVTALCSVGSFEQLCEDGYAGPASEYRPRAECWDVGQADGTCVLITRECLEAIGTFDLSVSPKYGWGLMPDLCIRAREAGLRVMATATSYCEHLCGHGDDLGGAVTATSVHGDRDTYRTLGKREMTEGLRRKWGDGYEWLLLDDESRQSATGVMNLDDGHISMKESIQHEPAAT